MIDSIKRFFGLHVHQWEFGEVYTETHQKEVPIIEEEVIGYDVFDENQEIIEDVETGEYVIETWLERFQDHTCSICGHVERRRV